MEETFFIRRVLNIKVSESGMTANGSLSRLRGNKNGATMPGHCDMISDNVVVA